MSLMSTHSMSIETRPTVPRALAGDQHRRAGGRVARIAVGVAAGDDADGHLLRRLVGHAVADALAGLQVLHGDDLRS